jgi:hypothetical protein
MWIASDIVDQGAGQTRKEALQEWAEKKEDAD